MGWTLEASVRSICWVVSSRMRVLAVIRNRTVSTPCMFTHISAQPNLRRTVLSFKLARNYPPASARILLRKQQNNGNQVMLEIHICCFCVRQAAWFEYTFFCIFQNAKKTYFYVFWSDVTKNINIENVIKVSESWRCSKTIRHVQIGNNIIHNRTMVDFQVES